MKRERNKSIKMHIYIYITPTLCVCVYLCAYVRASVSNGQRLASLARFNIFVMTLRDSCICTFIE